MNSVTAKVCDFFRALHHGGLRGRRVQFLATVRAGQNILRTLFLDGHGILLYIGMCSVNVPYSTSGQMVLSRR